MVKHLCVDTTTENTVACHHGAARDLSTAREQNSLPKPEGPAQSRAEGTRPHGTSDSSDDPASGVVVMFTNQYYQNSNRRFRLKPQLSEPGTLTPTSALAELTSSTTRPNGPVAIQDGRTSDRIRHQSNNERHCGPR